MGRLSTTECTYLPTYLEIQALATQPSLFSFITLARRYGPSKWSHDSLLFPLYLQVKWVASIRET